MHPLAQSRRLFLLGLSLALLGDASLGYALPPQPASPQADNAQDLATRRAFTHAVEAQRAAIDRENSTTSGVAWAGDYYFGDGTGQNVSVSFAPLSGVAATWQGCFGTYTANKGMVIPQADGSLLLKYEKPNDERAFGFADHVVPVAWGDRMYMISENELPAFASAVNLGDEPRKSAQGLFLMRTGDEQRKAYGIPILPAAQQSLIREVPLEVGVVSVSRLHDDDADKLECRYRLELDHGANDGLVVGMNLLAIGTFAGNRITLEQSTPTRAVGTIRLFGDECIKRDRRPSTRTRFTSGAYPAVSSNDKP
ncbi:hypothetical protein KK141_18090 [Dyella sp. LX-66]|uniref:hypothetical protein n=1 Tax=unclassified Dyella TaxID=2634549 RepID=UPI001BDFF4FD|nr:MULTISPECIES: hypothetical protein [unclassified Dyella]MBT2117534.1 hypothetical protein [Dyella sp. LX-1]MBT2141462.1 hypothetical protein [Dyella sp. LX-66]